MTTSNHIRPGVHPAVLEMRGTASRVPGQPSKLISGQAFHSYGITHDGEQSTEGLLHGALSRLSAQAGAGLVGFPLLCPP